MENGKKEMNSGNFDKKVVTRKVSKALVMCECRFCDMESWGVLKMDNIGFYIDYRQSIDRVENGSYLKFYI